MKSSYNINYTLTRAFPTMSSVKFSPFASALKAATTKINNITSEMDKKVDLFVDEVISKIIDYDEEFFTRNGNETDRDDMKESIKDLFKMFQPEKKKSYSGYILYCQEERNNVKERNPHLTPAQVTSALGAQWKALDADEKAGYNLKAKAMKPITEEKKAEKRSSSKGAKAGEAGKKPAVNDDEKNSEAPAKASKKSPSKKEAGEAGKEEKASKKAPSKKEEKASKKAPSKKASVCKSKEESTVKKSPLKSPKTEKTKDFDFSGEACPIVQFKKINLDENTEGKRWRYDPITGLCFEMNEDVLVARYTKEGDLIWVKDLPENIKNWAKRAGYEVGDEEEIDDIEFEGELSDDEE